jgi:RNA polymerase sigma-70 factor (ECF subfamily)
MAQEDETTILQGWLDRLRAGDDRAREQLLESSNERLARLARKLLRGSPGVRRWEQTDDVLQNALLRLDRALKAVVPPTSRDYFRLAAAMIRRELIDLARHHFGPEGGGAHHASLGGDEVASGDAPGPSDRTQDPAQLASWTEFHEQVDALDEEDRELFDLLWYQGLSQPEAARILGLTERQVRHRWVKARLRLAGLLGGELPE